MAFAENNGTKIYWRENGQGEPLVLIMGLGSSSARWFRIEALLAQHYRVILVDNRGVGQSDVPPGPYRIPEMAEDVRAVLDAAGINQALVFGISMGGYISQELVLNHPNRVRALILGCTSCGGEHAVLAKREVIDIMMNQDKMSKEESLRSTIAYTYHPETPKALIEEDIEVKRKMNRKGYNSQWEAIVAWDSTYERLPQIATPTLVIHGEADALVPPENAHILAERIPDAQLALMPKASHIFFTDQVEETYQLVHSFFGSV